MTQKAIALELRLALSTVSRALRGDPRISEETRKRVSEAAKRLGYQPNLLAASMRTGVTRTIGLVVMDITNPFYSELARGAEDCAYEQGYSVILCDSDGSPEKEQLYLQVLQHRRVDGVLMTPISANIGPRQGLVDSGIPYVLVDAYEMRDDSSMVTVDHIEGACSAVRHLVQCGHSRIAFIGSDLRVPPERMMHAGYRKALLEAGIKVDPAWVCRDVAAAMEGGYQAVNLLFENPNPPTAALCINDLMAIGAMQALEERGKRIPEDFAIVGYDDIPMAVRVKPALTTVVQNKYDLGRISTGILLHEIDVGSDCIHQQTILKPRLVIRGSTCTENAPEPSEHLRQPLHAEGDKIPGANDSEPAGNRS